jgi:hypothetical protein
VLKMTDFTDFYNSVKHEKESHYFPVTKIRFSMKENMLTLLRVTDSQIREENCEGYDPKRGSRAQKN